jgi:acetolactate synthase-1/2/3 large subunit
MNEPEVESACRLNLPIKVVLLNDNALGMVDQWQGLFHGARYSEVSFANSTKNFVGGFRADGVNAQGEQITHPAQLEAAMARMMEAKGPYMLEIKVRKEDCFPMMAAGCPHDEMTLPPEAAARAARLRPQMV